MHHKAIGITLNIPIQQNTMKIHRNKTKIIGFNKENTSEHHNNFILELNKQYTNPLKSNKCNIHQTILIAAKATGALRTKGSHQRNWKKTDLIPSNVKSIRKLNNIRNKLQKETDSNTRKELYQLFREKTITLHKKITGKEHPEERNIEETFQYLIHKINQYVKGEKYQCIKANRILRAKECGMRINQKRHFRNILEHKPFQEPITYICHSETKQIITKAPDMLKNLVQHYTNVHSLKSTTDATTLPFSLNLDEIYQPKENINPNWYQLVTQAVSMDELKEVIAALPNGKAPGITGESYELYKIIAGHKDAKSTIQELIDSINGTIQTATIDPTDKTGRIILLSKDDHWSGNMSRMRPITLLEPTRKILEAIIQTRLQKVLNTHKITDDLNFGFKKGYSTNEAITMIQMMVDTANSKTNHKSSIYAAALDVSAAFDTVPFSALELSMNSLKFPLQLQHIIKNLIVNEKRVINTIHGDSAPFTPEIGLPQGGKLSPLLWTIFYQPLLELLQKHTTGYKLPLMQEKVTAVAFADDLTPITTSPMDLQLQLDIIYSFLKYHGMKMNPSKSHILTNIKPTHHDFPTNKSFKLGNQPIESIKEPHEATRILGAWMSFDSNTTNTRKHALKEFEKSIQTILSKQFDGPAIAHVIETTLISKLAYRLQHVAITKTNANEIDARIRKAIRKCTNLPRSTNITLLQTKELLINIKPIKQVLEGRVISNFQAALRSDNKYGQFTRDMCMHLQEQYRLPLPIYQAPINLIHKHLPRIFKKLTNTYLGKVNNALLDRKYSLKPLTTQNTNHLENNLFLYLDPQIYATQFHAIKLLFQDNKLQNLVKTEPKERPRPRRYNHTKSKTQQEILQANTLRTREKYAQATTEPGIHVHDWLQNILDNFRNEDTKIGYHESVQLHIPEPNISQPRARISNNELPHLPTETHTQIEIWTDGSYCPKTKHMGSAAIILDSITKEPYLTLQCKPTNDNPSPQKAEIIAIIYALLHIDKEVKISIHTDSETTIKALRRIKNGLTARDILKETHYDLLTALVKIINEFTTPPIINKANSKTDPYNAQADLLAKDARNLQETFELHSEEVPNHNPAIELLLYHKNIKTIQYPIQHIKAISDKENTQQAGQIIINKNIDIHETENIDTLATLKTAARIIDEEAKGDRANFKVLAFNINTLTQHLETRDKLERYSFIHDKNTICKRCNEETEDNQHILQCQETKDKFDSIKKRATLKLQKEIDKMFDKDDSLNKYEKPTTDLLWSITGITDSSTLNKSIAKGIITDTLINNSKETLLQTPKTNTNQKEYYIHQDIIILTAACFRYSIYHEIWKPRTQEIFSENKQLDYQRKLNEKKQRREERARKKRLPPLNMKKRKHTDETPTSPPKKKIAQIIIHRKKQDNTHPTIQTNTEKQTPQAPPKKKIPQIIIYRKQQKNIPPTAGIPKKRTPQIIITIKRKRTPEPNDPNPHNKHEKHSNISLPPSKETQTLESQKPPKEPITPTNKRKCNIPETDHTYPPTKKRPKETEMEA